jgi:ABC-type transport system substrate-binding protein
MRKVKWIFFGYLAVVGLLVFLLGISLVVTPPRRADTFYTFYVANLKTLDPAEISDVESAAIVGNVFETLYNYQYGVQPYRLFPQVAAEMPQITDEGKTVTIKLRKGIRFYDPWKKVFPNGEGPEIKAQDFVYSWKRVSNFHLGNTANYGAMFEGKIVDLEEWWDYTKAQPKDAIDWDRPVKGFTALDDYTIQIKLVQPYPQLVFNLAHMPTAAVCRKAAETLKDDFKKYPIGSGPFVITDHLQEQRVVLDANPIYRGRFDVDGYTKVPDEERLPRMKRIQVDYFAEPVPRWLLFRQGLFDVSTIPRDAFNQAIGGATGELTPEMVKDGVVLKKSEVAELFYTGFNMLDKVVGKNKPLRQAISMAYDRDAFIRIHLNGRGVPANGPIPPGFPTYDPKRVARYCQFNLAEAKKKLAEAEQINGGPIPELTYLMGGTETQARQYAEFFVSQMAQIGLKVKFELRTWARFQEMIDDKQAQIFSLGWVADYPDEQTFLQLFYSKNAGQGGVNSSNYSNPEFDKLYEEAVVMEPSPKRAELYRKMQDVVTEECPWVYEYYPLAYTLSYNWLKNYFPMEYGNGQKMSWCYIKVDTAARDLWHKQNRR